VKPAETDLLCRVQDVGHPKLREHLAAVVMLMKYSPNWRVFMDRLDREFPQWGKNFLLPFPENYAPLNSDEAEDREAAN
jgi:hypothetical protein